MSPQDIAGLMTAAGLGTIVPMVIRGVGRWVTGRAGRERDAVARERARADAAEKRADDAEERADREARNRGRIAEAAATYRYRLRENGINPDEVANWPTLEQTIPRATLDNITKEQQ